jgi:peptidoglycan/LPS O-acetylase OafA/YrhL
MRRPAIGSTPSTRLPPALGPPTAAPLVLAGALLALAVLLAVLAVLLLAAGGLIVGLVGLVVAALAWGRQTPATDGLAATVPGSPTAPAGRPAAAPTGRPSPAQLRARPAQLPRRP